MVSGRRSSRYSIDYIIKFLFFLLVPVIILDLAGSFFIIDSMRRQTSGLFRIPLHCTPPRSTLHIFQSTNI